MMTRATRLGGLALAVFVFGCSEASSPAGRDAAHEPAVADVAEDPEVARLRRELAAAEAEHARLLAELAGANARLAGANARLADAKTWLESAGFFDADRTPPAPDADIDATSARLRALLRAPIGGARDVGVSGWINGTTYPAAWLAPDER